MPRAFYNEIFQGKEDENILKITEDFDSGEKRQRIIQILLEIIENDLTPKRRDIIKEYFLTIKTQYKLLKNKGVLLYPYRKKSEPESFVYIIL